MMQYILALISKFLILVIFSAPSYIYATTHFCGTQTNWVPEQSSFLVALNTVPTGFGKTHFIVGHPSHDVPQTMVTRSTPHAPSSTTQVFFTPDDDVRNELMQLINQESKKIRIAMFLLTDPEIAKSLRQAKQRGVQVELITDASCLKERANKINFLCDQGCTVYIYNPSYSKQAAPSIMHHKFVLFNDSNGKSLVWTGSYNFTKMASKTNQENALVLEDQETFKTFAKQFRRLKERSHRYGRERNITQIES